ncbi:transcriptional regulator family: Centromere protein BDNA-binding region [Penicillium daleae]|uniref:Transcriptional regulator family: Centromere protein BDNA-binding region n=1 Tax=Penicillium daleae TaxID=63821 RepID=A0AAD6CG95_9EURO|nr:transcriptional regulator family: Centromere protein BDNA-binding region [Penicillium daleae]KAJ5464821.1 transcriptional regulator family: Centromere protein BDNA-binding region [Penicillium daleae]
MPGQQASRTRSVGRQQARAEVNPTETGFVNSDLAFQWLQHFDKHTLNRAKKNETHLLLFDGHKIHLTIEFHEYCLQANILPFKLISHATHLIQPLDGDVFQTYKTHFRSWNRLVTQYGGEAVFFRGNRDIRDEALTPSIIRGSLRKRGIYPFKLDLVVKPLSDREERGFMPLRGCDAAALRFESEHSGSKKRPVGELGDIMDEQPDDNDWIGPPGFLRNETPLMTIPDVSVAETLDDDIWYDVDERSEEEQ